MATANRETAGVDVQSTIAPTPGDSPSASGHTPAGDRCCGWALHFTGGPLMLRIAVNTQINRPAQEVWDFFIDLTNW